MTARTALTIVDLPLARMRRSLVLRRFNTGPLKIPACSAGTEGEEMKTNAAKPQHWLWFGTALLAMAVIAWIVILTDL